ASAQRRQVSRSGAPEANGDDRLLEREHSRQGERMAGRLDEPGEERAQRDLGVCGEDGERLHLALRGRPAVKTAARRRRQGELTFLARRVEAWPSGRRPVTQVGIAGPQVYARS